MITTTHLVVNVGISRWRGGRGRGGLLAERLPRRLFLLGGVAPDLGLFILTGLSAVWFPAVRGLSLDETFRLVFDDLFYDDPVFVVAHNLLHAPFVVLGLVALGVTLRRRTTHGRLGAAVQAFGLGCLAHTALDIPVHHDDGPLLLFPLEWSVRFASPVSYYDPDHYGAILAPLDLAITVVGLSAVVIVWARRRRAAGRSRPPV